MTWPAEPPLDRLPSCDVVSAWHEAGHAICALALGKDVRHVRIGGGGRAGSCHWEDREVPNLRPDHPAWRDACRRGGAISAAGGVAVNGMRKRAEIPYVHRLERLSAGDIATYRRFEAASLEPPREFWRSCLILARDTIRGNVVTYLRVVDALIERRELSAGEVLELWHAEATQRV